MWYPKWFKPASVPVAPKEKTPIKVLDTFRSFGCGHCGSEWLMLKQYAFSEHTMWCPACGEELVHPFVESFLK